ncbi:MAG: hypothetical protein H7330_13585, partial [Hymenobacteraceae bacterium]|nr:hypothetical protein [Hymenobacteraceae bacterium]
MARPSSTSFDTPVAAVRRHFGLSQQQLAAWLGASLSSTDALGAGRKPVPAPLLPRLLMLSRRLPPPRGTGRT